MKLLIRILFFVAQCYFFISCHDKGKPSINKDNLQALRVNDTHREWNSHHPLDTMFPIADNSRIALDWEGIYRGIVPCADCEGIKIEMVLFASGTYRLTLLYLGKKHISPSTFEGRFEWDNSGNFIILKDQLNDQFLNKYQVGEEKLFLLNQQGQRFTGNMADKYTLNKYYSDTILTEKYWRLIELNRKKIENQNNAPYINFTDKAIRGSSGCNSFSGIVKITLSNKITFQNIATTNMACMDNEKNNLEIMFFNALNTAALFNLKNDTLTLFNNKTDILARFVYDYFGQYTP